MVSIHPANGTRDYSTIVVFYIIAMPPSTASTWPVMKAA
jgi:hypothetical protein